MTKLNCKNWQFFTLSCVHICSVLVLKWQIACYISLYNISYCIWQYSDTFEFVNPVQNTSICAMPSPFSHKFWLFSSWDSFGLTSLSKGASRNRWDPLGWTWARIQGTGQDFLQWRSRHCWGRRWNTRWQSESSSCHRRGIVQRSCKSIVF